MTSYIQKPTKRSVSNPRSVRINATHLSDEELESLAEYLRQDPNIEDVTVAGIDTIAPPPPTVRSPSGKPVVQFFTIQASAQTVFLLVHFVQAHWELLSNNEIVKKAEAGAATLAAKYVLEKIKAFNKRRKDKLKPVLLYNYKGDVIEPGKKGERKSR